MSIINCADKNCVYQKDGKCEFNCVVSAKIFSDGRCVHYRASEPEKQFQSEKKAFY